MKKTQASENPYRFSDTNKRYQTYDYYLKKRFGGKCARIPLDAGFSCPNKDGTCGGDGCIFCYGGSSGAHGKTLAEQYEEAVKIADRKWKNIIGTIPYLQANTNTYASAEVLRRIYAEAASLPNAVMLNIATRGDCLPDYAVEEICRAAEGLPVTVELGLQCVSDKTAERIGRGYDYSVFSEGYGKLRKAAESYDISVGVHIINGLPGEGREDMIKTAEAVASLKPELVKIHLLTVLKNTRLASLYERGEYSPMEREDYISVCCDQLEILPEDTVIGRLTGDGESDILISPLWSRRKTEVVNMIDKELYRRGSYQGIKHK